jgi:hypothetical protein
MNRIKAFLDSRLDDKASMLIWYFLMTPVFISAVGLAIDGSIMAATKSGLQTSLDAATQGTVALYENQKDGGQPTLSQAEATQSIIRLYDANRRGTYSGAKATDGVPFIICQGAGAVSAPSGCGFIIKDVKYSREGSLTNNGYLSVTVEEKADTIFLGFLGYDDMTYTVTSTARLTNTYN